MKPTPEIIDIVSRVPDLDGRGTVHGVTWEESAPVYDAILARGREGVLQVVGMLVEIDDGTDYKPRYLLHGISVYLGRPGKEEQRKMFCAALASELGGDLNKTVQGYLIRQLQVAGGKEVVGALGKQLLDEDNWDYAAQALLSIGGGVEHFRSALNGAKEKGMAAQLLTAAHALGVSKDRASADSLRALLGEDESETALVAAWGLANMGDGDSAEALLKYADAQKPGWFRTRATSHCLLLAENAGDKAVAKKIYEHLAQTRNAPEEEYIRDVAKDLLLTS